MVTLSDAFPSKHLKSTDLKDGPVVATIKLAELERMKGFDGKETTKVVLYFSKKLKPLPLNRTNFEAVMDICGSDDSDNFVGVKVEVYATTTQMNGKVMDCVRIRAPQQRELPKSAPPAPAAKKAPLAAEMDDEVPF